MPPEIPDASVVALSESQVKVSPRSTLCVLG